VGGEVAIVKTKVAKFTAYESQNQYFCLKAVGSACLVLSCNRLKAD
jgi:hypothetical protein